MCNSGNCKFEIDPGEGETLCKLPKGETCPQDIEDDEDYKDHKDEEDYEDYKDEYEGEYADEDE